MEISGGLTQKERESVYGEGTLDNPFRPPYGGEFDDTWLKAFSMNRRVRQSIISQDTVYLYSGEAHLNFRTFGIRLMENDEGLVLYTAVVLEPNTSYTELPGTLLERLAKDTARIQKIVSKELLYKRWFKLF